MRRGTAAAVALSVCAKRIGAFAAFLAEPLLALPSAAAGVAPLPPSPAPSLAPSRNLILRGTVGILHN